MKHKAKALTKKEVENGRSNAYSYIDLFFPIYANWLAVEKEIDEQLQRGKYNAYNK